MSDTNYTPGNHPDLPPPPNMVGPIAWLRKNLFSTWIDSALTLLSIALLVSIVPPLLNWAFFDAVFTGENRQACAEASGACWAVVTARLPQYFYGLYPTAETWRINIAFVGLLLAATPWLVPQMPLRRALAWYSIVYPFIAWWLLAGGFGLEPVYTGQWGGFTLTLVIGVTGIVASLPLGILLALGRQSSLPVISMLCVGFIETVRGVPLIMFLFMASNMLNLFLPQGVTFDLLLRALIAVTLFSSAYMAEVVRGGLQAIPKGQYEAAQAMGLTYWQSMRHIVLPQALRTVIPGIVNNFIALFKDTSLVAIIGLLDLLNMAKTIVTDADWQGLSIEVYVFVGMVYWIVCFFMSRYSLWLEGRLGGGTASTR
jgi:general L-amino acid transport system permease protein